MVTPKLAQFDLSDASEHCVRTIHAEQNAIIQAAKHGISLNGASLYVTMTPCYRCAMFIHSVGIVRVVCERKYNKGRGTLELFDRAGIEITHKFDEIQQYGQGETNDNLHLL